MALVRTGNVVGLTSVRIHLAYTYTTYTRFERSTAAQLVHLECDLTNICFPWPPFVSGDPARVTLHQLLVSCHYGIVIPLIMRLRSFEQVCGEACGGFKVVQDLDSVGLIGMALLLLVYPVQGSIEDAQP